MERGERGRWDRAGGAGARGTAGLLLAALTLAGSGRSGWAEEPAASPPQPRAPASVAVARPPGRRPEAREVWIAARGGAREEWIVDGLNPAARERFAALLSTRGATLLRAEAWPEPATPEATASPRAPDVVELLRGRGHLPPGYVPHGERPPQALPPLPFLGATVVLELVEGAPQARLLTLPEGCLARKMGLREGDAVLSLGGLPVDPASLAGFAGPGGGGGPQRSLLVRRTHGEIERIVLASWAR